MLDCKVTENMGLNGVVERRSETTPVQTHEVLPVQGVGRWDSQERLGML